VNHQKELAESAQLALDTILQWPTRGIPSKTLFLMQHAYIERLAGVRSGAYRRDPEGVYLAMQRAVGTCLVDQWIPRNPLTMGDAGYEPDSNRRGTATTGADEIWVDGLCVDSPEAVVEHLERFAFPRLKACIAAYDEESRVREILNQERAVQAALGPGILKSGYGFIRFPTLGYTRYGYEPYFAAYALYPEVMEAHFGLQADLATLNNRAAARAYREGGLPPLYRLDHDMADSRGTLVRPETLDRIWFPHFARCLEPVLRAGVRLIWHCDGNLMAMVPRLLEVGLHGFQGFQYEDGMDYARICRMKTRDGEGLIVMGGVSVTRTLPYGTPDDVRRELRWLVEKGPPTGLFLGASSSITPGVPWQNVQALVEGLAYYCTHGRS
jgi:uroporphyrinogen decarboxylase